MRIPDKTPGRLRRYGAWAGNPNGTREDLTRCAVEIHPPGLWGGAERHQCCRGRGHGRDAAGGAATAGMD